MERFNYSHVNVLEIDKDLEEYQRKFENSIVQTKEIQIRKLNRFNIPVIPPTLNETINLPYFLSFFHLGRDDE